MFEVSLAEARADEMHPAFANLFVCADWDAQEQALYFARKPRLVTEEGLHAVHFIAHADEHVSTFAYKPTGRVGWVATATRRIRWRVTTRRSPARQRSERPGWIRWRRCRCS